MSDERPVFARFRCPFAGMLGKELLTIEYFEARFWHLKWGMAVYPGPGDIPSVDWSKMYRLRINGKLFGPRKYSFYTLVEAAQVVEGLLECGDVLKMANFGSFYAVGALTSEAGH